MTLKTTKRGNIAIVNVEEICNHGTTVEFDLLLINLLGSGVRTIAVNCNELFAIESTAVYGLIRFSLDVFCNGMSLVLYGLRDQVVLNIHETNRRKSFKVLSESEFKRIYEVKQK